MRFPVLRFIIAAFVPFAIGRHIPPEALANISRAQDDLASTAQPPKALHAVSHEAAKREVINGDEDVEDGPAPLAASADDQLWDKHKSKGESLNCTMRGSDRSAGCQVFDTHNPHSAQSRWTHGILDMTEWNWQDWTEKDMQRCSMEGEWDMGPTPYAMGIGTKSVKEGGDLRCFSIAHCNVDLENSHEEVEPQVQMYAVQRKGCHVSNDPSALSHS